MFVAPLLYVMHALLTGVSVFLAAQMHWMAGFGFSAGLVDMVLSARNPLAQNWYMLLVQGLVFSAIYYFSFSFVIKAFNLKTPGREDEAQASAAAPAFRRPVAAKPRTSHTPTCPSSAARATCRTSMPASPACA
jgi:PTS system N-acetylglucosamine-specific IIC component